MTKTAEVLLQGREKKRFGSRFPKHLEGGLIFLSKKKKNVLGRKKYRQKKTISECNSNRVGIMNSKVQGWTV